jgi:hypothetical protein
LLIDFLPDGSNSSDNFVEADTGLAKAGFLRISSCMPLFVSLVVKIAVSGLTLAL